MALKNKGGTLIHYPSRPDFFDFDAEVAEVFDEMASRSIPAYHVSHRINARISVDWIQRQHAENPDRVIRVLDVGASTGGYLAALWYASGVPLDRMIPGVRCSAVDISRPMLDKLAAKLPCVNTLEQDVLTMSAVCSNYDIVNVSYVLQFLKPSSLVPAVSEIRRCMKQDGLLFLSQKEKIITGWADMFQNHYIDFRKENGYSEEEIAAKTQALKGSMFPQPVRTIKEVLHSSRFEQMQETSRWLQFSSLVAIAS